MGSSFVLDLAARGCNVVINDIGCALNGSKEKEDRAGQLTKQILRKGGKAVANYDSVLDGEKIVEQALREFGSVDIVINNAGVLRDRTFLKMTDEDWQLVIDTHLTGTYKVCHAAWPIMMAKKYGRIVNISSRAGLYGNFGQANYGAAKMGIIGLTDTLAKEGAKHNIRVNSVLPVAKTRMNASLLPEPLLDILDPSHCAPLTTYLSHASCNANGCCYEAGGGWFSKVRIQRSVGVILGSSEKACAAEDVATNFKKLSDFTFGAHYPESADDTLRDIVNANEHFQEALSTVYAMNNAHNTRLTLLRESIINDQAL